MFRKVLKQDLAYTGRYWWIVAITVFGMTVAASFACRLVAAFADGEHVLLTVACVLCIAVCLIAIFSSVLVTQILCYARFYKNFFTDEGYLTFTLPVSRKTLLLSKTVSTMIWLSAHFLLFAVCAMFAITFAPLPEHGFLDLSLWKQLANVCRELWEAMGGRMLLYLFELLLLLIGALWFGCELIQLCFTVGAVVAKKHKLLAAIGIYYGVNMVVSFFTQFVMVFGTSYTLSALMFLWERFSVGMQSFLLALFLLIVCIAQAAFAVLLHCITRMLLERRLNLA